MKDVSVEVDEKNRILHVTAKREHRAEEQDETVDKGAKWVAYERFYGKMDRSFGLPEDAVAEKDAINCRLVNGELTVSIKRNPPQEEEAEKQRGTKNCHGPDLPGGGSRAGPASSEADPTRSLR